MISEGKTIKNYKTKLSKHKGEEGVLIIAFRSTKPDVDLWSFSSNWQLVFSNYETQKLVGEVTIKSQLGYPFNDSLGKINRALFVGNNLLIATTCGHIVFFDCIVNCYIIKE